MNDGKEVELKLQLAQADIAALLASPIFADHDPVSRDQVSVYFDTDKHALHAAGLSLRIRTAAGQRVQTIKTESDAGASLFARGEWERGVGGDTPVLEDAPSILADALGTIKVAKLAPAFTVEVNRTKVVRENGLDCIELVSDEGRVIAGQLESPIAEIELELIGGRREALFELAHQVARLAPVRLGVQSKSERGYALVSGKQPSSIKAEPITLSRDCDTAALFEAVAGACIRQFRLNEDKLVAAGSPASLHQARVALRRLRSALSTFTDMLAGPELDRFRNDFGTLASSLGTVRDIDVMITKIDREPVLARLRAARTSGTRRWSRC
jgi:triphosphatase